MDPSLRSALLQVASTHYHLRCISRSSRRSCVKPVASSGKIDITKQGMNKIPEGTIKQNLMGRSRYMKDKNWVDPQGRKGKVRKHRHSSNFGQLVLRLCGIDVLG
jgi:hypothetical protein